MHGVAAIEAASKARDWNCYRLWSLVRLTGAIPLAAWGMVEEEGGTRCCLCQHMDPDVIHLLLQCPGTRAVWDEVAPAPRPAVRPESKLEWALLTELLEDCDDPQILIERVRLVGGCILAYLEAKAVGKA